MAKKKPAPNATNPLRTARRTWRVWRRLARFFRGSGRRLALLAVVSVAAGIAEAAVLALVATAATALSQGERDITLPLPGVDLDAELGVLLGVGVGLAVLRGVLHIVVAYLPASMSARAMADLRRQLFDVFADSAWSVKASERDGQFQSLMNAHITSTAQAVINVGAGVTALLMFGTLLASAFTLSAPAALVLLAFSMVLFLALRPLSRRLRGYAGSLSKENIEYSKAVQEVVLMAEETQVFGASGTYRGTFYDQVEQVRAPMLRTRFLAAAVPALYQSLALLVLVLALVAVSFVDTARIATLGAVVLLLVRSLTYGQQVQTAVTTLDERIPFMQRLADALDRYRATPQQDGDETLTSVQQIALEDVRFSYVPGTEVLHGITVTVPRGEAVGVVGPSGAGKSSVVQLLLRLRDPDSGQLLINGQDARTFRRADWRRRVAYVPQTSQLVWGTVADNIRFYRPELTREDVEDAARRAHIHDEVMSWPEGYDTVVGQRASAVSGGQRQRICLARALAARPEVLILDEPTSALDVRSEEAVQESLRRLKGEVTLFLVAHRLSTLSICDRVMVLVDGRLEAVDTAAELLAHNAFFREVSEITRRQSSV